MRTLTVSAVLSCAAVACANGANSGGISSVAGLVDSGASVEVHDSAMADDTATSASPSDSAALDSGSFDGTTVLDSTSPMLESGVPLVDATDDSVTPTSCESPDTCSASSTSLGMIAGDEPGPPVSANGSTSEWLRLDMSEMDNGLEGAPMILTATLTSPAGYDFDLYAYFGSAIGTIDCTMVRAQSNNPAGQTDSVTFMWGEKAGGLANGFNDSATVMLEIRWVSGACSSAATWSLSAQGD